MSCDDISAYKGCPVRGCLYGWLPTHDHSDELDTEELFDAGAPAEQIFAV
jgi:hypothetical protein